jgi:XTP/dITP diphosphohydrolase
VSRPLWIASRNQKKRGELERLLGPLGFAVHTLDELGPAGAAIDLPEDEPDFAGNARSKAVHLIRALDRLGRLTPDTLALGDDSGLCVDALDGAPGVRSARWAGPTDADRNRALLAELSAVAERGRTTRTAAFHCAICVAAADSSVRAAVEERCRGTLLDRPRGTAGFGYDPLFVPDETPPETSGPARSFAELTPEQKDAVSHRGKALRSLARALADG